MGLQITDTTPLDVSDGVYFISVDGSADLLLNVEKDNSADTTQLLQWKMILSLQFVVCRSR